MNKKIREKIRVVLLLLSILVIPIIVVAENNNRNINEDNQNINNEYLSNGNVRSTIKERVTALKSGVVNAKERICIDFLQKKGINTTIEEDCKKILEDEMVCVEYLKSKNIENSNLLCKKLFLGYGLTINSRPFINNKPNENLEEWQLKRIDWLIQTNAKAQEKLERLDDQNTKKLLLMNRAYQKKILEMNDTNITAQLKKYQIKNINKEMLGKKRIIAKEKMLNAQERYLKSKENFIKINEKYNENMRLFVEAKEKLMLCQNNTNKTECREWNNKTIEHARQVIINGAERLIEHLNKIKAKIEGNEELDEDIATQMINDINEAITKLEGAIGNTKNADTKEEIKSAANEVRNIWRNYIRTRENIFAIRLVHARVYNIIKRSEQLESRLDKILNEMKEKGINVTDIDQNIDLFSEKIANANEKYDTAEKLIKEAYLMRNATDNSSQEKIIEKMKEAKEYLNVAHKELKNAHNILQNIVKEIKQKGYNINIDEEQEIEVIEKIEN